jgi:hypothetical protein
MRLLTSLLCSISLAAGPLISYHVIGDDPGSWPRILGSVGLSADTSAPTSIFVVRDRSPLTAAEWLARAQSGSIVIVEGSTPIAQSFGFRPAAKRIEVQSVRDVHDPDLPIVWENAVDLPVYTIPAKATVFQKERWTSAPLMAGFRHGAGGVLWLAAPPGVNGYERFPYLLQALTDLGFEAPFRSGRLWAFFDGAYRSRVDLDYFAARWRKAGISALQVAAWHYWDRDPQQNEYLKHLIEACHKQGILVYAWLELPHVSDKFWGDHPEWREKTALLQDAQLDWRKLMNLTDRDCFRAVASGVRDLIGRYDWDGVNLAELYFESLEGYSDPARFTPMNDDVRREFKAKYGFDPIELFDPKSPRNPAKDATGMREFLDWRADLAARQQEEWIDQIEELRRSKPYLALVLTHVDDGFDTRMHDLIGADAARVLPLLRKHDFTFLIEDPATIWNLGPRRYRQIAARYVPLTPAHDKLAIDINVVRRYQDVYPTKEQTGTELFQLVHAASQAFPRVALYFENSIRRPNWGLLAASAAGVSRVQQTARGLAVDSRHGAGVLWNGPAKVDGAVWPVTGEGIVWLPPGHHVVEASQTGALARLLDLNADLTAASATPHGFDFAYTSDSRAMAKLERAPVTLEIDGRPAKPEMIGNVLVLPRGQHLVSVSYDAPGRNTTDEP